MAQDILHNNSIDCRVRACYIRPAMARVLLIEPPFAAFMGLSRWFFPMGLAVLANSLRRDGHDVLVYDLDHIESDTRYSYSEMLDAFESYLQNVNNIQHSAYHSLNRVVKDFLPDLVGISCMSVKLPAVLAVASMVKSIAGMPVVCGGPHASELPEDVLKSPDIDYVCRHDGRVAISMLVDFLAGDNVHTVQDIPNLSYKTADGRYVHNPNAYNMGRHRDWLPARDLLSASARYSSRDMGMVMSSIGCPFQCSFCSKMLGNQVYYRDTGEVRREIDILTDQYDVSFLQFKDDSLGVQRDRVHELCSYIRNKKEIEGWECITRIDLADDDLLVMLKRSKCTRIKVGVESGSDRILHRINKKITADQVVEFSRRAKRVGLKWSAYYMIGFPDETEGDVAATLKLIEESQSDHVSVSIFTPYPGSLDYNRLRDSGRLAKSVDWSRFDPYCLEPQFERAMPHERFVETVRNVMAFVDDYNLRTNWQERP